MGDALKQAARSAEERGYDARRDGQDRTACPCYSQVLRLAWLAGWVRADRMVF